jgi:hypothetical protein
VGSVKVETDTRVSVDERLAHFTPLKIDEADLDPGSSRWAAVNRAQCPGRERRCIIKVIVQFTEA